MKVAIDATYNPWGGSLSQLIQIIKYMTDIDNQVDVVLFISRKNQKLFNGINNNRVQIISSRIASISTASRIVWEQLFLPFLLIKNKVDILFCPGNIAPFFQLTKSVQWIGTIGPFWEEMYYLDIGWGKKIRYKINKYFIYMSAKKSDAIIFESNFTKNLFNKKYGVNPDKSYVINIGKDDFFCSDKNYENEERYSIYSPYLLCVSHLYPYKNIPRMIEAFKEAIKSTKNNYRLLIAGEKRSIQYYNEIINTIKRTKLEKHVILLGSVSKEDLRYLYSSCEYLIFPSPCENFAYTLVEAMCCGAAIVCANTTAMPETCKEAALYFDPNNKDEMVKVMKLLINQQELKKSMKQKSLIRVKTLPNYEEVTQQTYDIFTNLNK